MRRQLTQAALAAALAASAACTTPAKTTTVFPPEARRKTPPVGIEASALPVGAHTLSRPVLSDTGAAATLGGPAARERVVLFYRGHW